MTANYEAVLQQTRDAIFGLAKELGMSAKDVFAKSDLSYNTVTRFQNAETRFPRFKTVVDLCDAVGLEIRFVPKMKRRKKVA